MRQNIRTGASRGRGLGGFTSESVDIASRVCRYVARLSLQHTSALAANLHMVKYGSTLCVCKSLGLTGTQGACIRELLSVNIPVSLAVGVLLINRCTFCECIDVGSAVGIAAMSLVWIFWLLYRTAFS